MVVSTLCEHGGGARRCECFGRSARAWQVSSRQRSQWRVRALPQARLQQQRFREGVVRPQHVVQLLRKFLLIVGAPAAVCGDELRGELAHGGQVDRADVVHLVQHGSRARASGLKPPCEMRAKAPCRDTPQEGVAAEDAERPRATVRGKPCRCSELIRRAVRRAAGGAPLGHFVAVPHASAARIPPCLRSLGVFLVSMILVPDRAMMLMPMRVRSQRSIQRSLQREDARLARTSLAAEPGVVPCRAHPLLAHPPLVFSV